VAPRRRATVSTLPPPTAVETTVFVLLRRATQVDLAAQRRATRGFTTLLDHPAHLVLRLWSSLYDYSIGATTLAIDPTSELERTSQSK